MRLSANEGEPGFEEFMQATWMGKSVRVFVDGIEATKVIACDDEAGWLRRIATDADGNMRLNATGDEIETETLTGKVRIVLDDA